MVFVPLVYFTIFTLVMASYSDRQMLTDRSPNKVISEFMIVLVANIAASTYMLYNIIV